MTSRPPATTNIQIVAAVATLAEQVGALNKAVAELKKDIRADMATINQAVGGHSLQIADWKRDGKWLASGLVGLGAFVAFAAAMARDWLLHLWTK